MALARLLRPQGRRGEVLAELLTDFPDQLAGRTGLYLAPEQFRGAPSAARACSIRSSWLPKGKNEGRVVLSFAGVETIESAEALAGLEVLVEAKGRLALEEGAAYISDVVGCTVFDGDREIGVVSDVQFPATPDGRRRLEHAVPLLVVRHGAADAEVLIPFAREFVREMDLDGRSLRMTLPVGLLDLGSESSPGSTLEEG